MKLTLEEAKTKWCCYARAWNGDPNNGIAINRDEDVKGANKPAHNCLCIADECMAWEWEEASCCCNVPIGSRKYHFRGSTDCMHKPRGYCKTES